VSKPTVTLTLEIDQIGKLFSGGNRTCLGSELNPLDLALDIIEHANDALYIVQDALLGNPDRSAAIASFAWRASCQVSTGAAIVEALRKAEAARERTEVNAAGGAS